MSIRSKAKYVVLQTCAPSPDEVRLEQALEDVLPTVPLDVHFVDDLSHSLAEEAQRQMAMRRSYEQVLHALRVVGLALLAIFSGFFLLYLWLHQRAPKQTQ